MTGETHKVIYVIEVEVPDDYSISATHDAAKTIVDAVRTKTALPCRGWLAINEKADAVVTIVSS